MSEETTNKTLNVPTMAEMAKRMKKSSLIWCDVKYAVINNYRLIIIKYKPSFVVKYDPGSV